MNSAAVRMRMFVASVLFMAGKIAACGLFLRWNLHMRPASSLDLKRKQGAFAAKLLCATHTCVKRKKKEGEGVEKSEPLPFAPFVFWKTTVGKRKQGSSAAASLRDLGAPCIIHTLRSLINRPLRRLSHWLRRRSPGRILRPPLYPTCHLSTSPLPLPR